MEINGVYYHVEKIGDGPHHVLMLHGFTGNGRSFQDVIEGFENREDYTFILVDQLGHGKTDAPAHHERYKMEKMLVDLKSILDRLSISSVSIYGYSMGGRVALSFAVAYPELVSKLVLESASPGLEKMEDRSARKEADEKLAERIEKDGVKSFVDFWTDIPLFQSQKSLTAVKQEYIYQQRLNNSPVGLANSLRGLGTGVQHSNWSYLDKIECPVLLAAGEWDEKFVFIAQEMKKRIEKSGFFKINGAGHAIHVEQPRKFGKIVSEFLSN
ncbi:2-succinyl-6-hydroxy-2,4-cyclohexadiene-1-carboxylate synthase [Sutcliffiella horikoshii]|uniref:Putative 2-succinyl-6-hydroxy-2,4-cyclohexadiene-1-carboxylate synthase n=1 Tax=Sutcliffiella horikoshii TaxID=79883 RepID=A0ABM6KQM1_9BACI|nr:2-succinyl-6-hydroxy-2,4-cyclohexadiene-1-carboxylate synthase [Sutcliffiella horikoshii]ART78680.1 2-succinyl-6-hydroxy-2,4-cyclohexadiene-1-carboxylate synthase [Sutcliffiella horikoshii]